MYCESKEAAWAWLGVRTGNQQQSVVVVLLRLCPGRPHTGSQLSSINRQHSTLLHSVSLEPHKMFKVGSQSQPQLSFLLTSLLQIILASALVATAFAAGPPAYGAPAPYAPEKLPPQPYAYEYGVADDYSKANFKKTETQDANGLVSGSFVIALPDGRIQTTTYTADHVNGFVADVTYEGTPVYPPEPKEGYGHAAPAYKPAPAYHA